MKYFRSLLFLIPAFLFPLCAEAAVSTTTTAVFLTSGTSWTVPSDWNSSNNTIEVIGGGGAGESHDGSTGAGAGGGGAYSKVSNVSLSAGAGITYSVGAGGVSADGGG